MRGTRAAGGIVIAAIVLLFAVPLPGALAACHVITFVGTPYQVSEGAGKVTITVSNNGAAGEGSVDYQTKNGTAKAGQDYSARSGTVTWALGDGEESFDVPISNDTGDENNESFTVELSNPTGCAATLDEPAVVTIVDNDAAPKRKPSPTPAPTRSSASSPRPRPSTQSPAPSTTQSPTPTPTPSPTPTQSPSVTPTPTQTGVALADEASGGMSSGAIAGIVGGALLLGGTAAVLVRRRFLT